MAQFQVYRNPRRGSEQVPYLLDVQSDVLNLATRWIVPLVLESEFGPRMTRIHPSFIIESRRVVMSTGDLAGVPLRDLRKVVLDLSHARREICAALDFMLNGY